MEVRTAFIGSGSLLAAALKLSISILEAMTISGERSECA